MLRQFLIFFNGEIIFIHSYATCLSKNELEKAKEIMQNSQVQNKTISRRILDYMIFHYRTTSTQFSFIADLTDPLDYIDKILRKIVKEFIRYFPDPIQFDKQSLSMDSFLKSIREAQHDLHTKISLIGPIGAGKTTLYDLIKTDEERKIMNFAKVSTILIGELKFDVWDMQLNDNHSLLWLKIIGGSDLVIMMFDASNYNLQVLSHFLSLKRRDSNLSKILILANKCDLITPEELNKIKSEMKNVEINELSLIEQNSRSKIIQYISNAFKLIKKLPPDFPQYVQDAEKFEIEGNLKDAIAKYEFIVNTCADIQDLEKETTYSKKLNILKKKLEKIEADEKARIRKKKHESIQGIKFSKKIKVQSLPNTNVKNEKLGKVEAQDAKKNAAKKIKLGKLNIKTSDIQANLSKIKKHDKMVKELSSEQLVIKKKIKTIDFSKLKTESDFVEAMQILIEQKGSYLSTSLAKEFIVEMKKSLGREIDINDLNTAVDIFIKSEKQFFT
ncbi:MAG: GTPase domain-containing protein [Candidatus Lokiarchaeota archaeon]|nr:GTPase domain-containing protein [Candidatus Lokiarchaeota archaeon]